MTDEKFINDSLDYSFNSYLEFKDNEESKEYNSFYVCVIRMLIIIYGEELIDSFTNKDIHSFEEKMSSFGLTQEDLRKFIEAFEKCYRFENKQKNKAIKKKNKFFNLVQKILIDMLILKNQKEALEDVDKEKFYELLFTANTKDFYRKSIALVSAYNPYEIDEYYKKNNI